MGTVKSLMIVPPGMRIKTAVIDGEAQSVLVAKTHRKGFKLSKKTRDRISASARRFKVPVITVGANLFPAMGVINSIKIAQGGATPEQKSRAIWNETMAYYTFIEVDQTTGKPRFSLKGLLGLGTNVLAMGIRRSGVFKRTNAVLTKSRIPISLS